MMTAWQVFATSSWFERYSMQRCGCFSVDREGNDVQALKTAVDIMQNRPYPLVIFPEGDVYHVNDRITPFRDGAAAMALMAARKADRPVSVIPVAIKRWYRDDPTQSLCKTVQMLEERLYWRPQTSRSLSDRVLLVADGLLSLKELEHFGETRSGSLTDRKALLASHILAQSEMRYSIANKKSGIPERVKEIRRSVIAARESAGASATLEQIRQWSSDMDNVFLVTQLYSYPGDYLIEKPTVERLAETLDKLEEDALGATYPTVHGEREVLVDFDEPIELPSGKEKKLTAIDLTDQMERRVQTMLDRMNAERERGEKIQHV
jgi:hypothetical protein